MIPRQGWSLFTREAARSHGKAMKKAREARKRHVECLGGSRDPFGVPKDSGTPQGGTREAGKDHLACEPPGRHQGGRKGPLGQPGRHQGGKKGLIGQPASHQGGTREAGKDHLDSLGGTREAGKD